MSITAMKQALEALEWGNEPMAKEAITALRAAIAEHEKCEPFGVWRSISDAQWVNLVNHAHAWEGFSKDEAVHEVVKMTEAKCRENNTHPAPVPAGWQLVPVEPTEEMKVAGSDALGVYHCGSPSDIYKAMKQAAPKPGESHD